MFQIKTAI